MKETVKVLENNERYGKANVYSTRSGRCQRVMQNENLIVFTGPFSVPDGVRTTVGKQEKAEIG